MTYSSDFRKKVLSIKSKDQLSMIETAKRFGIGVASVMRWSTHPEIHRNRNKPATKIDMETLKQDVELFPDADLKERAERFNVSHNCIWQALKRLNITYKKNTSASKGRSRKAFSLLSAS